MKEFTRRLPWLLGVLLVVLAWCRVCDIESRCAASRCEPRSLPVNVGGHCVCLPEAQP